MKYGHVIHVRFVSRPNRFIARVLVGDKIETVHVKNTGRCRELHSLSYMAAEFISFLEDVQERRQK